MAPRTADTYIVNDQGTRSPFAIELNGLGLSLFGNSPIDGHFGPGEEGETSHLQETPITINSLSNGMGCAYSGIDKTYAFALNGYCRGSKVFMPGGKRTEIPLPVDLTPTQLAGEIRCGLEFNGDVVVGAGEYLITIPGGTGSPVLTYHLGDGAQVDSAELYNGIPIFSTDDTFDNWQYLTAYDPALSAWKTAHQTGAPASNAQNPVDYANPVYLQKMTTTFQEVDGTGAWRLHGNDSPFTYTQVVATDVDTIIGDSTSYGASLQCGDTTYPIANFVRTNHIFYILKIDGVYGIESSGIYCPNYTPEWREHPSLVNGISGIYLFGKLFAGRYEGLEEVDVASKMVVDKPSLVSPSANPNLSNETPIFGIPVVQVPDAGWNAVWLWNGFDSHLCYVGEKDAGSTLPAKYVWHGSECTIPNERVTFAMVTGITGSPRMLIGTHDGTRMHLYWLSLPREGNAYQDYLSGVGTHEFCQDSRLFLSFNDWKDASAKKVMRRYSTQVDGLSVPVRDDVTGDIIGATQTAELLVYGNADSGSRIYFETVEPTSKFSEWSYQGSMTASPKASMIPSGTATEGSQIALLIHGSLIDLSAEPGTTEPVYMPFAIRSIKLRAEVIVEQLETKDYTLIIGEMINTQGGSRDISDVTNKFTQLASLQDSGPVTLRDELHMLSLVKVEPGIAYKLLKDANQHWYYVVRLSVTYLGRPFFWDIQDAYDSIYAWGS